MSHTVRRIGLLGGECTGKSELAHALGVLLPACVVDERLRSFVERHGRPPDRDEQWSIMAEQQRAEDDAAATCSQAWVVVDPAPLMTAVYSIAYFADDSLLDDAIELAAGYDQLLWCDTDLPWLPDDGQRDGPEARDRVHALLTEIVRDRLRPQGIPVRLVSGSLQERLGSSGLAWQPGPLSPPT